MFLKSYSFYLERIQGNLVTYVNAYTLAAAIANCQKTLDHLSPSGQFRWEHMKATLVEEKSVLNFRKVRATLFEIDELVVCYQRDKAKKLQKAVANHVYHYVLAENAIEAIRRVKNLLEPTESSHFHEVVYQECNHRPLCLPDIHIQHEQVRQCRVATN